MRTTQVYDAGLSVEHTNHTTHVPSTSRTPGITLTVASNGPTPCSPSSPSTCQGGSFPCDAIRTSFPFARTAFCAHRKRDRTAHAPAIAPVLAGKNTTSSMPSSIEARGQGFSLAPYSRQFATTSHPARPATKLVPSTSTSSTGSEGLIASRSVGSKYVACEIGPVRIAAILRTMPPSGPMLTIKSACRRIDSLLFFPATILVSAFFPPLALIVGEYTVIVATSTRVRTFEASASSNAE